MRDAGAAVCHAREKGRDNLQIFAAAINVAITERPNQLEELRAALCKGRGVCVWRGVGVAASAEV